MRTALWNGLSSGDSRPSPVDTYVGSRIRHRRLLLGISQRDLGNGLGLTFQQIQKYESGANRVGASRLFEMSRLLDVTVAYFFEDMPDSISRATVNHSDEHISEPKLCDAMPDDQLQRRATSDFVHAYCRISDPIMRKCLLDLVKALALFTNEH